MENPALAPQGLTMRHPKHGLGVAWFQQLVGRRASGLKAELELCDSGDRYRELLRKLDELSAMVSENAST
jgi:hypothetical protein